MKRIISKNGNVLNVKENIKSWTIKYKPVNTEENNCKIIMCFSCNISKKDCPNFESLEKHIKNVAIFNIGGKQK